MLSIAVMNGWPLRQMDVNNVFLHRTFSEIVYMMQPPGFKNLSRPDYVRRLRKAIYGFKQPLGRGIQFYEMLFYKSGSTILQLILCYLFIAITPLYAISLFKLMTWSL